VARALLRAGLTPPAIGEGVTVGLFIGLLPLYGLHLPLCVVAARARRLNVALVYGAANISNPLFAPALIAGQVAVGEWLRRRTFLHVEGGQLWEMARPVPDLVVSLVVGALVSAAPLALAGGGTAWAIARWWQARRDR
jgi:uncharacterized protein (DUF2062 family)